MADVFAPTDATGVADLVSDAHLAPLLPRGFGRSYGDASLNAGEAVIDMTGVSGIDSFTAGNGTVTVAGGTSFDDLLRFLVPRGFFVPVTPGTRFVTAGGAIAADVHGKNHHGDGSLQQHLLAFDLLLANGETVAVTAEADPRTFSATCGGLGLTGIVTRATLRSLPIETAFMAVTRERTPDLATTLERIRASDAQYRYSVAWVDCLARGRSLGRSVIMQANHARLEELPAELRVRPLELTPSTPLPWPRWSPSGLVRPASARLFNQAFYRKAPAQPRKSIEGILSYFYPLDRIKNWNRAYGPRGFVQYQFVVPEAAHETLKAVIARLADGGCPSLFAVLKRMGPGAGMLSFPIAGWTLALDIPASAPGLAALLDELDEMVSAAGGRVYLAKDARMRPEMVAHMYPDLDEWRAIRAQLDPGQRWQSDLSRRLEIV